MGATTPNNFSNVENPMEKISIQHKKYRKETIVSATEKPLEKISIEYKKYRKKRTGSTVCSACPIRVIPRSPF